MMKLTARLLIATLAALLVLPLVGCQQKAEPKPGKGVDIQVDAGGTKVKVEGSKKPGEKGRHVDVDVERHPNRAPTSGDQTK
jgi:hypothetical protein